MDRSAPFKRVFTKPIEDKPAFPTAALESFTLGPNPDRDVGGQLLRATITVETEAETEEAANSAKTNIFESGAERAQILWRIYENLDAFNLADEGFQVNLDQTGLEFQIYEVQLKAGDAARRKRRGLSNHVQMKDAGARTRRLKLQQEHGQSRTSSASATSTLPRLSNGGSPLSLRSRPSRRIRNKKDFPWMAAQRASRDLKVQGVDADHVSHDAFLVADALDLTVVDEGVASSSRDPLQEAIRGNLHRRQLRDRLEAAQGLEQDAKTFPTTRTSPAMTEALREAEADALYRDYSHMISEEQGEGYPSGKNFDHTGSLDDNLRELTATATLNTTACPSATSWMDTANWPPNANIGLVPVCAREHLTTEQLDSLGFYDLQQGSSSMSTVDLDSALANFASSTSASQTEKKVVSFVVQSISKVNLFRDPASTYLPKDRYKVTTTETYESPANLDVHLSMFVYPKRVRIGALCPSSRITDESITNAFANSPGASEVFRSFWGKWQLHAGDNFRVDSCTTQTFDEMHAGQKHQGNLGSFCKTSAYLKSSSKDKYRMFCSEDFQPANYLSFAVQGPLTGHWLYPGVREDTSYAATMPEQVVDLEATYSLTFDQKFLDVERNYMTQAQGADFVNGQERLWAAEPLARGKALCSKKIRGCQQGVPANPPMLLPGIVINVNKKRTRNLVEAVKPLHWPEYDSKKMDELMAGLDNLSLELHAGLRTFTAAEDGHIAIKPMTKILIQVQWQINPIYIVDKWTGAISLDRWATSVSMLNIGYADVDYSMRSSCSVRLLFAIDPTSQRFQEIPILELKDFLAFVGAYAGYIGMVAAFLGLWQKLTKPFGVVDIYYVDSEYANVVGRWYTRQMKMLGFGHLVENDEEDPGKEDAVTGKADHGEVKDKLQVSSTLHQAGLGHQAQRTIIPQPLGDPIRWAPSKKDTRNSRKIEMEGAAIIEERATFHTVGPEGEAAAPDDVKITSGGDDDAPLAIKDGQKQQMKDEYKEWLAAKKKEEMNGGDDHGGSDKNAAQTPQLKDTAMDQKKMGRTQTLSKMGGEEGETEISRPVFKKKASS
ncbi:unnamed protein product [Amoebophrya sp. A25]|nr:unnamed protein product [Amoebophrya sp. A25]|eukprot:GSA25T00016747001.1